MSNIRRKGFHQLRQRQPHRSNRRRLLRQCPLRPPPLLLLLLLLPDFPRLDYRLYLLLRPSRESLQFLRRCSNRLLRSARSPPFNPGPLHPLRRPIADLPSWGRVESCSGSFSQLFGTLF